MSNSFRFQQLVKSSGHPEVATLWGDPKKDGRFMKAVRANRVVTVKQKLTAKTKDFGTIGFHEGKSLAYFIFPEPLPERKDARVIGIKYDLLSESTVVGEPQQRPKAELRPQKKKSEPKKFSLTIRRVATIEAELTIEAMTQSEAERNALKEIQHQEFDPTEAVIQNQIRSVHDV
jgi:hypothetical protein